MGYPAGIGVDAGRFIVYASWKPVMLKHLFTILFLFFLTAVAFVDATRAQIVQTGEPVVFGEIMPFVMTKNSSIWLEGSANVVNFECRVTELRTEGGLVGMDTLSAVPVPHGDIRLEVHIPVDRMDCGRSVINRDMRQTLISEVFPYIVYSLDQNQMQGMNMVDGHFEFDIKTWGKLKITNNEREEEIAIKGTFLGPWRFRVQGAHQVNMRDYGLEPPSAPLQIEHYATASRVVPVLRLHV
jgi:hypothetical protein